MKTFLSLFLAIAVLHGTGVAQIFPGAVPWVNSHNGHLTSGFDANGDGLTDVLDLNRAQGSFTLGIRQPNGTYLWSTPVAVGFADVDAMAVGKFITATDYALMVCSRDFNNIQPVPLDGSDLPVPLPGFNPPEPQTLVTIPSGSEVAGVVAGYAGGQSEPLKPQKTTPFYWPPWQNYQLAPNARHAGSVYLKSSAAPVIAIVTDDESPGQAQLQIFRASDSDSDYVTNWPGLPAGTRYVPGFFAPDFSSQTAGYHSATLVTWVPGSAHLRIARLTAHDVENNTSYEDLTLLPLPITFNMQRPIGTVTMLYKAGGHRLLLTFSDAAGGAAIYDFDGVNVPELVEGLALNGLSPDAFTPLNGGDFLAHGKRGGLPAYDLYHESSPGHYTATATGTRPELSNKAFYSNVVAFSGEPFVADSPAALKRARVSDWTTAGTPPVGMGGAASITALQDSGPGSGLSGPTTTNLSVPAETSHLLLSQISPLTSISFHSAKTVHQSQLPVVQFTPPGGTYPTLLPGETFEVVINVPGTGFDVSSLVSINGGPWQYVSRFEPVQLSGPASLRAYAYSYLSGTGPIISTEYSFANQPPLAAPTPADVNMNGLADDWEALTGITNPSGDHDGDGILNLAEHNSGYDPNDPNSKPAAVVQAPNLQVIPASAAPGSVPSLRWDALDTAILLETSADMQSWTLVTHGTRIEGHERVFDLPTSSFPRRFYRLRR